MRPQSSVTNNTWTILMKRRFYIDSLKNSTISPANNNDSVLKNWAVLVVWLWIAVEQLKTENIEKNAVFKTGWSYREPSDKFLKIPVYAIFLSDCCRNGLSDR